MLDLKDLEEYYKSITNAELLSILENKADYQPQAIEIAKKEFALRQLSDIEIHEAKEPLVMKEQLKEKQREKIAAIENRVKNTGITILDTLNPIQEGLASTEKKIRYIVLVWFGIFIYQLVSEYGMIKAYILDLPRFPYDSLFVLLPYIFLLLAVILFWRRKKTGWILLTAYLIFSFALALFGLFFAIKSGTSNHTDFLFIPRPSPYSFILPLIIFGSTLYVLSTKNIRETFSVSEENLLMTVGAAGVISFFLVYGLS